MIWYNFKSDRPVCRFTVKKFLHHFVTDIDQVMISFGNKIYQNTKVCLRICPFITSSKR